MGVDARCYEGAALKDRCSQLKSQKKLTRCPGGENAGSCTLAKERVHGPILTEPGGRACGATRLRHSLNVLDLSCRKRGELTQSCRESDTSTGPNLNLSRKTSVLLDGLAFVVDPRDVLSITSSRPFSDLSDWRWHVGSAC
jgi:hypothetical protein